MEANMNGTKISFRKLGRDTKGQDFLEYALIAGLLAVSFGATLPDVTASISGVMSQVVNVLNTDSTQRQPLGTMNGS
jgi:Flp pilus assembly pilin Flp